MSRNRTPDELRCEQEISDVLNAVAADHGAAALAEAGRYESDAQLCRARSGAGRLSLVRFCLISRRVSAAGDQRLADLFSADDYRAHLVRPGQVTGSIDDDVADLVEHVGVLRSTFRQVRLVERLRLIDAARRELDDLEAEAYAAETTITRKAA